MSYDRLRHGNESKPALGPMGESPAYSTATDRDSDDERTGDEYRQSFEMRDLNQTISGSTAQFLDVGLISENIEGKEGNEGDYSEHRRGSASTIQSFMLYTPDEERAVINKFDRNLVLLVALLYMLSFLDRSSRLEPRQQGCLLIQTPDIGNARIAGMEDELHLESDQYEWLLRAFYIAYILFEWMTLLWKVVPPHIYRKTLLRTG